MIADARNRHEDRVAYLANPDAEDGWTAREIALFDDRGDMIVVGGLPATAKPALTSGAGAELIFRVMFTVSNATAVTLRIAPSIVLASRRSVDAAIAAHAHTHPHVGRQAEEIFLAGPKGGGAPIAEDGFADLLEECLAANAGANVTPLSDRHRGGAVGLRPNPGRRWR